MRTELERRDVSYLFKLRLTKERDVELAAIHVQRDIARAHSDVVGEALKHAKIDIVGGENDFFEKIVRAVGQGKAVDRMMSNSETLTDIKNTFFNGDPEYFRGQLRQWVQDFGIKSEDLKNLTIAALLAKWMGGTSDAKVLAALSSALSLAKNLGLADKPAASVIA